MRDCLYSFSSKVVLIVVVMLLFGCGTSPPTRFYLIGSLSGAGSKPDSGACVSLTVGPVRIPEYANRPQIVTRAAQNELLLGYFDRWGEPLGDTLPRVIAENLSSLLCAKVVYLVPGKPGMLSDYRVEMDVTQIDGILGREAILEAWWTISSRDGKAFAATQSRFSEPVQGEGYDALVQAHSRSTAALSREIAKTIQFLAGQKTAPDAARR